MKKFFSLRFFWSCNLVMGKDGYYYHRWSNWVIGDTHEIFAGYKKNVVTSKDWTWMTVEEKIKDQ